MSKSILAMTLRLIPVFLFGCLALSALVLDILNSSAAAWPTPSDDDVFYRRYRGADEVDDRGDGHSHGGSSHGSSSGSSGSGNSGSGSNENSGSNSGPGGGGSAQSNNGPGSDHSDDDDRFGK
jgi:hypothetical protein